MTFNPIFVAYKKYNSTVVFTYLYNVCKSQYLKIPHNALISKSDLIREILDLWDHPFNQSIKGGVVQICTHTRGIGLKQDIRINE